MITDLLLDHAAIVPGALAGIVAICLLVGHLLARTGRGRRALVGLSALTGLAVLALTLTPSGKSTSGEGGCAVQFALPTSTTVELLANIVLFVPPVLFATLATRRPLTVVVLGSSASVGVEALQALLPAIGRACDTNDWFMNTVGVVVGVLLALGSLAAAGRRVEPARS